MENSLKLIEQVLFVINKYPLMKIGIAIGIIASIYLIINVLKKYRGESLLNRVLYTILIYVLTFLPIIGATVFGIIIGNNKEEILQVMVDVTIKYGLLTYVFCIVAEIFVVLHSLIKKIER